MRLEITIPDQLYSQAQHAAASLGLSVDRYMADALQVHLREEKHGPDALRLTSEQAAFIRKGQAEVKAGKFLTMEQVEERSAADTAEWLEENRH